MSFSVCRCIRPPARPLTWLSSPSLPLLRFYATPAAVPSALERLKQERRPQPYPRKHWEEADNRLAFLEQLRVLMQVEDEEGWRTVRQEHIAALGGKGLLHRFGGSIRRALQDSYPHLTDGCRPVRPRGMWRDRQRARAFLESFGEKEGVKEPADWLRVTTRACVQAGGMGLLNLYGGSLYAAVSDLLYELPERQTREKVPEEHWDDAAHVREFLDRAKEEFGVEEPADWARVSLRQLARLHGGHSLLSRFSSSLVSALRVAYPEETFTEELCRPQKGRGHWLKAENRRRFMDQVAREHNVTAGEDWARVSSDAVQRMGGHGLLRVFGGSMLRALQATYPELQLDESARPRRTRNFWESREERRKALDAAAKELGVGQVAGLAQVDLERLHGLGLGGLLVRYDSSIYRMLKDTYPEELAGMTRADLTRKAVASHWGKEENIRAFVLRAEEELRIKEPMSWARVAGDQLLALPFGHGFLRSVGLQRGLELTYPDVKWAKVLKTPLAKRSSQHGLLLALEDIFEADQGTAACQVAS